MEKIEGLFVLVYYCKINGRTTDSKVFGPYSYEEAVDLCQVECRFLKENENIKLAKLSFLD